MYLNRSAKATCCFFLTETKMQMKQSIHQFIECPNYYVFNKDRKSGRGGGVLILVRNDLVAQEYADKSWEDIEAVSCKLKLRHLTMKLICIYRPPSADSAYNAKLRETIREVCSSQNDQVVICGDFNFPQINWSSNTVQGGRKSEQSRFVEACNDAFLYQHVRSCTRVHGSDEPSLLDLVLTKDLLEVEDIQYRAPIGSSDHCVLNFDILVDGEEIQAEASHRRNFIKGDFVKAAEMFRAINWHSDLRDKNVQDAWDVFFKHYEYVVEATVPLCANNIGGGKRKKKWMTHSTMNDIQTKGRCLVKIQEETEHEAV